MEILNVATSSVTSDGSLVSLTFETDQSPLPVVVDRGALANIVDQLAGVLAEAKRIQGGTDLVAAQAPKQVSVRRSKDRQTLILIFHMPNGHQIGMALPKEACRHLRSRIDESGILGG